MRQLLLCIIISTVLLHIQAQSPQHLEHDSTPKVTDINDRPRLSRSLMRSVDTTKYASCDFQHPRRPWIAGAEVVSTDVFFHLVTRYLVNESYAHISWKSIKKNFQTGFIWDNDQFKTNLFSHPYQGNLYYNCARSNGLNFWQSAPYAFAGSAIWEFFGENQPPSTNDIFATTFGGIGLGEVAYRVSSLILDEKCTGAERIIREAVAGAINPVRGVNRLIYGDAWKHGNRYVDKEALTSFTMQIGLGFRHLSNQGKPDNGHNNMACLDFLMIYNDPFTMEGSTPFEYFDSRLSFNFASKQPFLSMAKVCASIWSRNYDFKGGQELMWGIFQNYNYYNTEPLIKGSDDVPYRIAETVSYGPGLMVRFPIPQAKGSLILKGFTSGIILGGSLSEHFKFQERDYNLGSGYSARAGLLLTLYRKFAVLATFENYHIFTWKGYEKKDYQHIDPNFLNAQGAVGNARLQISRVRTSFELYKDVSFSGEVAWYKRKTHYKYFDDEKALAFESRLLVTYTF